MSKSPFGHGTLRLPNALPNPDVNRILESIPTARKHNFESAGEFLRKLAARIMSWNEQIPDNARPVILAMLPDGSQVEVVSLTEDGHSGVVIEGLVNQTPCLYMTHQAGLQILCYTKEMEEDDAKEEERRSIGFHVDGETLEI